MKLKPIIGIEVHIELKTDSKMFCHCSAYHFQIKPNINTCPICLGLPGALPLPNKKAIESCLKVGLALSCKIPKESKFDRKNYFYPDLPKGFQISQYDKPFCTNGYLTLDINNKNKKIGITRVHMEEDTGKLLHKTTKGIKSTFIDFNRSGVPLVEIVTEPDINSAEEAVQYLKKLQQLIRYLDVSDCDMEKGSMRCEVNISLSKSSQLPKYKVEVKNLNSFKFVKKALEFEIQRQKELLKKNKTPIQETRGFDESTSKTYSQRRKEEAHDYRYFPEPDIPPIFWSNETINKIKASLPELPEDKIKRYIKEYKITEYNSRILMKRKATSDYFDILIKTTDKKQLPELAKLIVNKKININKLTPKQLLDQIKKQKIQKTIGIDQLKSIINKVLKKNKKAVEDYGNGKHEVIGFLIGQVMKVIEGKAEVNVIRKILIEKLKTKQ